MTDIRAIFFDVDGTLIGPGCHTMSSRTLEAMHLARAAGVFLFLNTGRTPMELSALTEFEFDGYATMNGQYCFSKGEVLRANPLPREDVKTLVSIVEAGDFACCFVERDRAYINRITDRVRDLFTMVHLPMPPVGDIRDALDTDIFQINFFTTPEHERELLSQMPGCMARRWSALHADVIARSGGKREGVQVLLDRFGLTRAQAMSVGDGENDIDMFRATGLSVATGNAEESVRGSADFVTGRYDEDGVAQAIERFVLGA